MPKNEKVLTYLEVKKLIKKFGSKAAMKTLEDAVESGKTGIIFLYRRAASKIIIKRYRTEKFIGILEGV